MPRLSIIVPSYNTKETTIDTLHSLLHTLKKEKTEYELIVVDNGSTDGSQELLHGLEPQGKGKIKIIENKTNVGYSRANNQALKLVSGTYILFLNSDVKMGRIHFGKLLHYLDDHPRVGVVTVKVLLQDGRIDPASHRGFPSVWNSFCYYTHLEKLLGRVPLINKLVGGYHMTYLDLATPHEIDSGTGAFYLTRRSLMERTAGFDERFFMYGEDLDLSYRIKKMGYRIEYLPTYTVIHFKSISGLKQGREDIEKKTREYFYDAMKIFYRKHYALSHPPLINWLVYLIIDLKRKWA